MGYYVNTTEAYHQYELETLGWELTVCNAMEHNKSPVRRFLNSDESFGKHLVRYIEQFIPMSSINSIMEIGGGYGYVLRDILNVYGSIKAVSVDISSFLLQKQKVTQMSNTVAYINADILSMRDDFIGSFDMVLLNEIMGDLPTVVGIDSKIQKLDYDDKVISRVCEFFEKYNLTIPESDTFNFNIGACKLIELLCSNNVKYIYTSEHSCEPAVTDTFNGKIKVTTNTNPEQIRLKGHYEYTVKFSHLQKIANYYGFHAIRGNYTDFIKVDYNNELNFIITSNSQKDEHEIVRQFLEDLLKYEYMILIKE